LADARFRAISAIDNQLKPTGGQMLSYQFYKTLHLIGVFMVLCSLGGIGLYVVNGGTKNAFAQRKWLAATHGIGLLISFVAGFGLLAKLGLMSGLPVWVILKMVIWLILGALPAIFYRKEKVGKGFWFSIVILAAFAAYLAINKPFSHTETSDLPPADAVVAPPAVAPSMPDVVPSEPPPAGSDAK
jgi:hypothetical protein